jgi:acetylornithine deacetylase/succinyl-diaminopimelate desuccinylase-like protein
MSAEEQAMLAAVPDEPDQLRTLFGIAEEENPALSLQEVLQRPSFNIRGLASEFVGASARTIIPDRAVAAIDIRLVKETPPEAMKEKVRAHLVTQGYHIVEADPDDATRARYPKIVKMTSRPPTNAYRMSPTAPESKIVIEALTRAAGQPPVIIRTSGATAPIAPFIDAMGFPAMSIPIVNFDNNQHGENENVRLGHFFRGITTIAALLTM